VKTRLWLLAGLILLTINLRAAITGMPPLIGQLQRVLALSGTQVSVLATLPVLCLGAFAWLAVVLWKASRLRYTPGQDGLGLFATFWHFLGALWVYLFLLLFVF